MINEEILKEWEDTLQCSDTNDWDDVIEALIAEVRELRERLKRNAEHLTISINERVKLEESLKQETVHLMDALNQIKLRREEMEEAEQILGKALGYPPYPICNGLDHRESPAVKTDEPDSDWVCVGDNTLPSLCDEIVDYLNSLIETIGEERGKNGLFVAKVKQLEKEADWLAENAGECPYMSGGSTFCWRHCPMWVGPRDRSGHCEKPDMREAARKACNDQ